MYKKIVFIGVLFFAGSNSPASGQVAYDFIETPSNRNLATLTLSKLPAGTNEIVSLAFTAAGKAALGFSANTYGGLFFFVGSAAPPVLADDGLGGLGGGFGIFDDTGPGSSFHNSGSEYFVLSADDAAGMDSMLVVPNDFSIDNDVSVDGDWRLVPEPAQSVTLLAVIFGAVAWLRRQAWVA